MRPALLKACNRILPHTEEKYTARDMNVDLAKNKQTAQLSGFLTRDGLRGVMEGRNYFGVDTVIPLVAAFTDKSLGFVERYDLPGMTVLYSETVKKMLIDQRCGGKG